MSPLRRQRLPLERPPDNLCLIRLSAIGDVMNVVPIVHTLRRHWPDTRLTWVVAPTEVRMVGRLPGVDFHVYDKAAGGAGRRQLRRGLAGRRFDVLCLMHAGLRPSLVSLAVPADLRLGFDRERSRDLHSLFVGHRIESPEGRHVVDGYFGFLHKLGLPARELDWSVPVPEDARIGAVQRLPDGAPWLLISPCASFKWRNWRPARYAAVADHAARSLGMRVALIGGPSEAERHMADAIRAAASTTMTDLVGDSPLEMLVPLLARGAALITPDSGPAHIANAAGVPTIALHAATDSRRSGPYLSLDWCVDRFDQACRRFLGKPADALPWDTRVRDAAVMDLIGVDDVIERLEAVMARRRAVAGPAADRAQ